jgi:hypothetical protein
LTDEDNFFVVRDLIFSGDPIGYFLFHSVIGIMKFSVK